MNGGLSYQVADPPFAIPGPRLPRVRAPPILRPIPVHAEGLAAIPASPGEPRPDTRQRLRIGVKV
jgi:hypothetical protein